MDISGQLSFDKLPNAVSKLLTDVDEIKKLLRINRAREEPISKKLSTDKAIAFFLDKGCSMSKSKLYKLTSKNQIPFSRFGARIVFDEVDLSNWIEAQMRPAFMTNEESIKMISKSAKNKLIIKQTKNER